MISTDDTFQTEYDILCSTYDLFSLISSRTFETLVKFTENVRGTYPLSFLLGFFVTGVIDRWLQMYMSIPWLNRVAFLVQVRP